MTSSLNEFSAQIVCTHQTYKYQQVWFLIFRLLLYYFSNNEISVRAEYDGIIVYRAGCSDVLEGDFTLVLSMKGVVTRFTWYSLVKKVRVILVKWELYQGEGHIGRELRFSLTKTKTNVYDWNKRIQKFKNHNSLTQNICVRRKQVSKNNLYMYKVINEQIFSAHMLYLQIDIKVSYITF